MSRSIEALVDEQVRRWQLLRRKPEQVERGRPVITVTGQHGARGDELALQLAKELGFDHFDREIIHRIAESAHLSEQVVASVDGKKRELLTDWLAALASHSHLSATAYRYHLARVIGVIAHQGGAVILGRGAHLLLGRGEALRVLAVAPFEDRVRSVMEGESLSQREAQDRVEEVDANRRAFILTHYRRELVDPSAFDQVVNTSTLGLEGSIASIRAALATFPTPALTARAAASGGRSSAAVRPSATPS
jgi:cytidylate kinase